MLIFEISCARISVLWRWQESWGFAYLSPLSDETNIKKYKNISFLFFTQLNFLFITTSFFGAA